MAADNNLQCSAAKARFILQQSQNYLDSQLRIALAADTRAITIVGIYTTLATALGAASLGYWERFKDPSTAIASLVTVTFFLFAAASCLRSAMPAAISAPGNEPKGLWAFSEGQNFADLVKGESHNYQERIDHNDRVIKRNARWFFAGALLGLLAPVAGILTWGAIFFKDRICAALT